MQCQNCGQRPAVVHQTTIMNGERQETHLCEVCAQTNAQSSFMTPGSFAIPNLSIQQLLASFLGQEAFGGPSMATRRQAEPQCKNCGMTYSEFAESGRLGCAECYDHLDPHLVPLIKRIHGTITHGGKAPKRTGGIVRQKRELMGLKQQLITAVSQENFEEAAQVRDRIREMETQMQAGGGGEIVE